MASYIASRPSNSRKTSVSACSSAPPYVKLKDSCVKCAASKIKCTKEKPSCHRCFKKGLSCEYDVSRRSGRSSVSQTIRRPDQQGQAPIAPMTSPPALYQSSSWSSQDRCSGDVFNGNNWMDGMTESDVPMDDADWESLLSLLNTTPTVSAPQNMPQSQQFSNYEGNTMSMDFDSYNMSTTQEPVSSIESDSSVFNSDWTLQSNSSINTSPTMHSRSSVPTSPGSTRSSTDSRHCLASALSLLMQLSPSSSAKCTLKGKALDKSGRLSKTADSHDGKATVDALQNIMDCPCSWDDTYLLTIVALITLKELSLCSASNRSRSKTVARSVMSEMHEVRKLIRGWSLRVTELQNGASPGSVTQTVTFGHSLGQLQNDLWTATNKVSAEAIDVLKRG